MLTRFIKSVLEIVRPSAVRFEVLVELRRRTFELGGNIEAVVAITPKNDAVHVVDCGVTLVLEFEIVRIHTNTVSAGGDMRMTASIPRTVRNKSVDSHRLDAVALLSDTRLEPGRVTFPARLAVPEEPPRPPDDAISSVATWKVVANLELGDGNVLSAEQAVTERG